MDHGVAGEDTGGSIVLINPSRCLLLLGSVVGCFEGIGLVLPIQARGTLGHDGGDEPRDSRLAGGIGGLCRS